MADNRRRAGATALTGYTLVAGGGALRGHAIDEAHDAVGATRRMKPAAGAVYAAHQLRVPRRAAILRRFGLGTALVTIGAPAAAKGTYDLLRRNKKQETSVAKLDPATMPIRAKLAQRQQGASAAAATNTNQLRGRLKQLTAVNADLLAGDRARTIGSLTNPNLRVGLAKRKPLVVEGVTGTEQALQEKTESLRSGAPLRVRAIPIGLGAAGAGAGSLLTHRILDRAVRRGLRIHPAGRSALTAVAAVPAALATLPISRRLTRRTGYQVTPTGVRKAWRKTYDPPDYRGRHTPVRRQRAAIYAAGGIPAVGSVAAARIAGAYAPPGQERRTSLRQFTAGPVTGTSAGVLAAHQLARASERSPAVADATEQIHRGLQRVGAGVRAMAGPRNPSARMTVAAQRFTQVKTAAKETRVLRPFFGTPQRAIASAVGYSIVKPLVGQAGSSYAMHRNQVDQRRYNAHHPVAKADTAGMSQRERDALARRKRTQAVTSVITGSTGLGALGLLVAAKHPRLAPHAGALEHHRNSLLAVGAGVGGLGSFNFAGIQRREARADTTPVPVVTRKALLDQERRNQPRATLAKYDRIRTDMHEREARRLVRQYGGLRGPLPSGLSRDERMRAWQARYVAAGGHKAHRWQRRAEAAEITRNAGLVGGAVSGAAWLAATSPRGRAAGRAVQELVPRLARISHPQVKRSAERTAVGAATLGASAELAGEYARHRRASYTSAPGGVAASALRRMQDYTPGDNR